MSRTAAAAAQAARLAAAAARLATGFPAEAAVTEAAVIEAVTATTATVTATTAEHSAATGFPAAEHSAATAIPTATADPTATAIPTSSAATTGFPAAAITGFPAAAITEAADSVKAFRRRAASQERVLKRTLQRRLLCMGYRKSILAPPVDLRRVLEAAQAYESLQGFYQSQDPETADDRMSKAYTEIQLRSHAPSLDEFLKMVEEAHHEQKAPTVKDLLGDTANRFLEVQVEQVIQRLKLAFTKIVIHGDLESFNRREMDLAILDADAAYSELVAINAQFFPEEKWKWSERIYNECRKRFWSAVPDIGQLLVAAEEIRDHSNDVQTPFNTEPARMTEILQENHIRPWLQ